MCFGLDNPNSSIEDESKVQETQGAGILPLPVKVVVRWGFEKESNRWNEGIKQGKGEGIYV